MDVACFIIIGVLCTLLVMTVVAAVYFVCRAERLLAIAKRNALGYQAR